VRLDPIFVLAPRPKPPSMSTRRAFVGMGIAFVTGGVIGSACGYAAGRAGQAKPVDASTTEELQPTGNADLDEVRRLAVKAPIEELMRVAETFLATVSLQYARDEVAWQGVVRIAAYVVEHPEAANRARIAKVTLQVAERAPSIRQDDYAVWIPRLKGIK